MSDPPGCDRVPQGARNRFLTDQIFKPVWPQLARQYDVGHSGKGNNRVAESAAHLRNLSAASVRT